MRQVKENAVVWRLSRYRALGAALITGAVPGLRCRKRIPPGLCMIFGRASERGTCRTYDQRLHRYLELRRSSG